MLPARTTPLPIINRLNKVSLYVIALLVTTTIANVVVDDASPTPEKRCIDFDLSRIDAITQLSNGSLFLVSGGRYWLLKYDEIPKLSTARPVTGLIPSFDVEPNGSNNQSEEIHQPSVSIDASVNIQLQAKNGKCLATNQLYLLSSLSGARPLITVVEGDVSHSTTNVSYFDVFRAAHSIDWSKKVDAMTFYNNMTIIFQGEYFTSIRCHDGKWEEILHKKLSTVFPGVLNQNVDSVFIRNLKDQPFDLSNVLLFYRNEYIECSTTGNDPCEGPYNVMSEFFRVDQYCSNVHNSQFGSTHLVVIILTIIACFFILFIALILYFMLKPEHFTYFVNGKLRDNYSRDQLSYEALKLQCDGGNGAGIECKSVTNGKS